MYVPPQFKSTDPDDALRLMRGHPLAKLISVDDAGLPFVTHLRVPSWNYMALHCTVQASLIADPTQEDQRALALWMERLGLVKANHPTHV